MASGQTMAIFTAQMSSPPASNYATLDTRNDHPVLDYDDTTGESSYFQDVLPRNYNGGGLTATIGFSASTATTGNVVWDLSIERIDDSSLDIDADSFASAQSVTAAAPGTSGMVKYATIAFTAGAQMDNLAAGEMYRLKLARNAASGGDTMSGDAEINFLELRET